MTIPAQMFEWLLVDEGGLTDHPDDDLGITKYGVTQTDLMSMYGRASEQMIKDLTLEQANEIFTKKYWRPLRCSELPPAVAYVVFDCGVLHGIDRAARWLQTELNVIVDGKIGPKTIAAAKAADAKRLIEGITKWRKQRALSHQDYKVFGTGWMARFTRVKTRALKLR